MSDLSKIVSFLDQLLDDTSVPKNVRASIANAKERLQTAEDDAGIATAIYALDEVSSDINLPMHAGTIIWNFLSEIGSMNNSLITAIAHPATYNSKAQLLAFGGNDVSHHAAVFLNRI